MAKKNEFPPVLIVSGSEELLRRRFLQEMRETQKAAGWTVEDVEGSNKAAVLDALEGDMFIETKTLAVVNQPDKVDLELLEQHTKATSYLTTLLLHIEGEPDGRKKFGKFVKEMDQFHKSFPKPKEWDAPAVASEFVIAEMTRYGKTIPRPLAGALVQRVGFDLGMLSFECLKIATLADGATIEPDHVKGGMAQIAEAAVGPILDALETRNRKKLVKALDRVRATSKYDPTMRISRFLGSTVQKWLQAVYLENLPPRVAAQELGLNPWYFENKVLPAANRWGKEGVVRLTHDLAAAERSVLNGAISPWTILSARLLASC